MKHELEIRRLYEKFIDAYEEYFQYLEKNNFDKELRYSIDKKMMAIIPINVWLTKIARKLDNVNT